MRKFQRHRRSLTWIASLSTAAVVASFGATGVLAEDAACYKDGKPVTQQEADADPTLCPATATTEPAPTEPAPTEPAPTEPAPTEPAPTEPAPTEPAPTEPAPTEPAPTEPAPTEPAPTEPAPTEPAPVDPQPVPPVPTSEDPAATRPATTRPATNGTTATTKPTKDPASTRPRPNRPTKPVSETKPRPPAPTTEQATATERPSVIATAKEFLAPFRDARVFREQFTPEGRIPRQPDMAEETAELLQDAAEGTGTSWATLTAIAWLESRWGQPGSAGLVGRRLDDAAWRTYGTDGDGDGEVTRTSEADRARTLAMFLSEARDDERAALEAYFSGINHEAVADRTEFLADYFAALGTNALVNGLEDAQVRAELEDRVLANDDLLIYDGGRGDITAGLVDPRVLVTMEFLANRFNSVTVSSIISGHGVYTASGNVSLHSYGQAFDIAALDGESVLGNQQRDSRTYRAVQEVLLLPKAMQPAELISLWDMGGPAFAMADHHDHIHIGWKNEPGN